MLEAIIINTKLFAHIFTLICLLMQQISLPCNHTVSFLLILHVLLVTIKHPTRRVM